MTLLVGILVAANLVSLVAGLYGRHVSLAAARSLEAAQRLVGANDATRDRLFRPRLDRIEHRLAQLEGRDRSARLVES